MRGSKVDLKDIVVGEIPEPVDLSCDEVLQFDEEEEQQVHEPTIQETYQVSICCGLCRRPIKFVCLASISSIRGLETLLFGSLDFVCVQCVNDHKLNHGG